MRIYPLLRLLASCQIPRIHFMNVSELNGRGSNPPSGWRWFRCCCCIHSTALSDYRSLSFIHRVTALPCDMSWSRTTIGFPRSVRRDTCKVRVATAISEPCRLFGKLHIRHCRFPAWIVHHVKDLILCGSNRNRTCFRPTFLNCAVACVCHLSDEYRLIRRPFRCLHRHGLGINGNKMYQNGIRASGRRGFEPPAVFKLHPSSSRFNSSMKTYRTFLRKLKSKKDINLALFFRCIADRILIRPSTALLPWLPSF